ncbi:MAG: FtsX-like permease family protein [Emcibacter sp.]|nr:FtsX-like permease family protein [Emcibacter sp.]
MAGNVNKTTKASVLSGLFLIATRNIKRDKMRSSLVFLTIALSTMMFMTALVSLQGFSRPIVDMLDKSKASHILLNFDARIYDVDDISDWWRSHKNTESLAPLLPTMVTTSRPVHDGKAIGSHLILTERPKEEMKQDYLAFMEGEPKPYPASGEIWLASSTAQSAGLHIDDYLELATASGARKYRISAIVVDPHYSSGFTTPERAWLGPDELTKLVTFGALNNYTLGILTKDTTKIQDMWGEFNSSLGGGFSGGYTSYEATINSYSFLVDMLGIMILVFGVISLFVALFIISSTISGEIMANYRTFGVIKSIGYTPRNVVSLFQVQFIFLAILALPLGAIGSYFVSQALLGMMLRTIGTASAELAVIQPVVISFIVLMTLVAFVSGRSGKKASIIKPAISIRFGAPEPKRSKYGGLHIRTARYIALPIVLGLKNLLVGKRRDLYDLIGISITAFVFLFSVNVFNSTLKTSENLPFWGLDGAAVNVKRSGGELFGIRYKTLKEYLIDQPGVLAAGGNSSLSATIPSGPYGVTRKLSGNIVDGNLDDFGYINLEGRNPVEKGEISVGYALANKYNLDLGSDFALIIKGQKKVFQVSGIFQTSSNSGFWYRTRIESIYEIDPNYEPNEVILTLEKGVDRSTLMDRLESSLGSAVDVEPREKFIQSQLQSITLSIGMVLAFLSLVFLLVSIVNIFNSTVMGINESKKQFGIYKAIGFVQSQIRLIMVSKSVILGILAIIIGLGLYALLAQPTMSYLGQQIGMPEYPMIFDVFGSLLVVPVILISNIFSVWLPSRRITKIKPRELIVE